jgi:acyl carrier protein
MTTATGVSQGREASVRTLRDRPMGARLLPCATLTILVSDLLLGCGQGSLPVQPALVRIRTEVAELLGTDVAQVDVTRPLVELGADELNIVEIVMAVEDMFDAEIPDSALGQTLAVQGLAALVSPRQEPR